MAPVGAEPRAEEVEVGGASVEEGSEELSGLDSVGVAVTDEETLPVTEVPVSVPVTDPEAPDSVGTIVVSVPVVVPTAVVSMPVAVTVVSVLVPGTSTVVEALEMEMVKVLLPMLGIETPPPTVGVVAVTTVEGVRVT